MSESSDGKRRPHTPPAHRDEMRPGGSEEVRIDRAYSFRKVAVFLDCHPVTVSRMVRDGELQTVPFRRRKKVPGSEVLRMLGVKAPPPEENTAADLNRRRDEILLYYRARAGKRRRKAEPKRGADHDS